MNDAVIPTMAHRVKRWLMQAGYHIVAVDPGETTGVAWFMPAAGVHDASINHFSFAYEHMMSWLMAFPPEVECVWVVENFLVYPWANLSFNELIAPRVIGAIDLAARMGKQQVVFHTANEIKIGPVPKITKACNFQVEVHGKCGTHAFDAACHLVKFAISQGATGKAFQI